MIEGELEPLLAGVVHVGEAEQVAGDLPGGVVAAVLARGVHARDAERLDLRGLGRLAVPGEIEELAVEVARDAARELLAVESERLGEARNLIRGGGQLGRVHPDRVHRRGDRQRLPVAVGDGAAVRDDLQHAREARVALLGEEAVIDELQVHGPVDECEGAGSQQAEQQRAPASGTSPVRPRVHCGLSWAHDLDLLRRRQRHVQLRARDPLNEGMGGPGALFQLQLTPFDFQVVPARR